MRIRLTAAFGMAAALLCLTACRSSPDVAAYVGDTKISEQRVTELLDGYNKVNPVDKQIDRPLVVQYLVHDELCEQLRKEKGFTVPPQTLPNDVPELAVIAVRTEACLRALPPPPEKLTDSDYRALYDRASAAGLIPADVPFDQVKQQWLGNQELNGVLLLEKTLNGSIEVTVNPRYGKMPVIGFNPVVASLGRRTVADVVVDRPLPAPTGQPQR